MKGIQTITLAIVLILLAIAVIWASSYFVKIAKANVDIVTVQEALRSCCGDRSIYNCVTTTIGSVICKVPWGSGSMKMSDLMIQANITDPQQINNFCFCS